jgi:HSP20 family protein
MAGYGSFWDPWEVVDPFDIMRRVWTEDYPEFEARRGVIEPSSSARESSALTAAPQGQGMAPYRRQQHQRKGPIRMDMIEASDSITVIAEMPGFKKEDIRINVDENNVMEISAERREERTQQPGETIPHRELHYGWHKRLFKLPSYADPDNVQSEFTNGMLGIKFGRRAVPGHRQIPIQ